MANGYPGFGDDLDAENKSGPMLPPVLRDPVGVLRRGKTWAILSFLLLLLPALFGAHVAPLQYEATTQLMLTAKRIPDEYVPTIILAGVSEQFQAIRGQVFTRPTLAAVIRDTGLYEEDQKKVPIDVLVEKLRNSVTIGSTASRDEHNRERSVVYRISIRDESPKIAADVVNMIASKLIDQSILYRTEQSRVTSDFMRREFEQADEALRTHQRRLVAFREKHRGSLPEEEAATISKLDRLESQRRSVILQINDVQLRQRLLQTGAGAGAAAPPDDLAALKERLAQQLALYTPEHPNIVSLKHQIEIAEKAGKSPNSTRSREQMARDSELASLRAQLASIEAEVERLDSLVTMTPKITEEFQALKREEKVLQESYSEYLRKLKSAELSRSMENAQKGASLTRIEEAIAPRSPVIPRLLFYIVAVVAAVGFGLVMALLHELIKPVVVDEDHMASVSELPILGSIPRMS